MAITLSLEVLFFFFYAINKNTSCWFCKKFIGSDKQQPIILDVTYNTIIQNDPSEKLIKNNTRKDNAHLDLIKGSYKALNKDGTCTTITLSEENLQLKCGTLLIRSSIKNKFPDCGIWKPTKNSINLYIRNNQKDETFFAQANITEWGIQIPNGTFYLRQ